MAPKPIAVNVQVTADAASVGPSSKRSIKTAVYKESSSELSEEEEEAKPPPAKKPKLKESGTNDKPTKSNKRTQESSSHVKPDQEEPAPKVKVTVKTSRTKADPFSEESLASHPCRCGPPPESAYHTPTGPTHRIGAHTSAAGGVEHALVNASQLGARALALFLKNQKKWESKPYEEASIGKFRKLMLEKSMGGVDYPADYILPHGSYLINLGNPDASKRAVSYKCFVDDLKRCEQLGIHLYNWHPGSTVGACTKEEALKNVAESINRAHKETEFVIPVIENMAGAGNILGSTWEEITTIIKHVDNKDRVGVCLDTCHMFAAGYDIRTRDTYEESIASFDRIVGLKYLKGMHINDSQGGGFNCKKDRHENIGLGEIGMAAFRFIVQDSRLAHIPLILETPTFEETEVWKREIEILYQLQQVTGTDEEVESVLKEMTDGWRSELADMRAKSGKGPKPKPVKAVKPPPSNKRGKPSASSAGKKGKTNVESESDE